MFSPPLTRSRAQHLRAVKQPNDQEKRKLKALDLSIASNVARNPPKKKSKTIIHEKENIQTVVLSKEEKAMDGAPEGELVQVKVLSHSELRELSEPTKRAKQVLSTVQSEGFKVSKWSDLYSSVDSMRQLSRFHNNVWTAAEWAEGWKLVEFAAESLRSAMVRNAILCAENLCELPENQLGEFLSSMIRTLLIKSASEKKFIREMANEALLHAIKVLQSKSMLPLILHSADHKNSLVVQSVCIYSEKCLTSMVERNVASFNDLSALVLQVSKLMSCKLPESRRAVNNIFQILRRCAGESKFAASVNSSLTGSLKIDVLRDSAPRKTAKSGHATGMSLKERMLAAASKKQ